jgi:hypothetical protein
MTEDQIRLQAVVAEKDEQLATALDVICRLKGEIAVLKARLARQRENAEAENVVNLRAAQKD